jgi:HD-like signal output (HDOD) protein
LPQAVPPPETTAEIDFQTDEVTIPVKLCNLPPLNAIASQLLVLTADPDIDLGQLTNVIGADPALSADVLFLANSSLFGFPARMHSLRHAMALLGLDRVKALAMTVAMRGFVGKPNPLIHKCWQHSVACALVCDEISTIFDMSSDRAYTAGIMHDVGRLGLLKSYPKEMTPVLTGLHLNAQAVLRAEWEALNVDHARAGSWLVSNWVFPKDFLEVCEHHHSAPGAADSEILQLVKAACSIADIIGFPAVPCQQQPSYRDAMSPLRPRLGRRAAPPVEELRANVTARLAAFEN